MNNSPILYRQPFENDWPITQEYGENITSTFHTGIDYGCPEKTRILASSDGTVVFAGMDKYGYGNCVIIQHNSNCSTLYAHLSIILVYVGEKIKQGECIGLSGNTGNSTGPHLHFEARKQWSDYKTHFNPRYLPLTSFNDVPVTEKLKNAKDLIPGEVYVSAPAGVFAHFGNFTEKELRPFGDNLTYTGKYIEKDGLQFCECYKTFFIAVNDGETQLLENKL